MRIRRLQDGNLYKLHDQKLDNPEKSRRFHGNELTKTGGFGILNMLGGLSGRLFCCREISQQNDNPWSARLPANQGLSGILNI